MPHHGAVATDTAPSLSGDVPRTSATQAICPGWHVGRPSRLDDWTDGSVDANMRAVTHPLGPFLLAHPPPVRVDPAVPSEPPFPGVALRRLVPVDEDVFAMLATARRSRAGALFRLLPALDELTDPAVLVLDDVHRVNNVECRDILRLVIEQLPQGWQVAVGSREDPWLPVARWRVEGGSASSAWRISRWTTRKPARCCGQPTLPCPPPSSQSSTGGLRDGRPPCTSRRWPSRRGPFDRDGPTRQGQVPGRLRALRGAGRAPGWMIEFLTRTSLVERLSGPLCDAVLDADGSAELLACWYGEISSWSLSTMSGAGTAITRCSAVCSERPTTCCAGVPTSVNWRTTSLRCKASWTRCVRR